MKKILSICIPTYNMELFLSHCLNSFIVDKIYMDKLEIIVVNDGSKDSSSSIAHEYAVKYPNNYIVIDKSNGNYGSCINAALKIASGKYFKICDADDKYDTKNLIDFITYLEKVDTDIVFSSFSTFNNTGIVQNFGECPNSMVGKAWHIDDIDWRKYEIMRFREMHGLATKTMLFKNNKYVQTEGISYTDTQFSFYSLLYSNTCSFFNKSIYLYNIEREGQTTSISSMKKSHFHFYINADKMLESYRKISDSLSKNKQSVLLDCIYVETLSFVDVFLGNFYNVDKQVTLVKSLLEKAKQSYNFCPLEEHLLHSSFKYRLWKKYYIPIPVIYILSSVYRCFSFVIKRKI